MKHFNDLQAFSKKQGKPCIFLGVFPLDFAFSKSELCFLKMEEMEIMQTYRLTNREEEILGLLALGLGYKEIASNKFISTETVKQHLKNIYRKMGVHNRVRASMVYSNYRKSVA
jgi:DNA-binding NarL/FixJ family response regulator